MGGKRMRISHVAGVLVMSVLVPSSPAQESPSGERIAPSEAAWSAITQCARIAKDSDRHVCLDDALRNAGLMSAHPTAAPVAQTPDSVSPTQSKERPTDYGLQPKTSREPAIPRTLQVTLKRVDHADGKLFLTTTEDAIWRQVESAPVFPEPTEGQTMTVEKGSFGGFFCVLSKYVSFRCYRAK